MKHYHNTCFAQGHILAGYESKAETQDDTILELLQRHPGYYFSAEDVLSSVLPNAPLTSARRALSNLYKEGLIEKTGQVEGCYGRPITLWRLR